MSQPHHFDHEPYRIKPGKKLDPEILDTKPPTDVSKKEIKDRIEDDTDSMYDAQRLLWANKQHALLIILQGLDASGKDSAIRHVMSGVNPQGCNVTSFRAPSEEEREHHFLWRPVRFLPARGRIAIFNRSYYEEVLVVRVHPEFLTGQGIDPKTADDKFWKMRCDEIAEFEAALTRNNTSIIKFWLHHSKEEQKARFIDRLDNPEKHWKFSLNDVRERDHWGEYMHAFAEMLPATSTKNAPWYAIPSDNKWFARALIADIIAARITALHDSYPNISAKDREELEEGKRMLAAEDC